MSDTRRSEKGAAHQRLIDRLHQQAGDVDRLTAGLDEERLSRQTVQGKWSLKELVCHLERVQGIFEARVEAMVTTDNPVIVSYEPEGDPEFPALVARPGSTALDSFRKGRERLAGRLGSLAPAEWHRVGRHPEYAHYDVHFAVEYLLHHEAHHIYQMFQRRAPLGTIPH